MTNALPGRAQTTGGRYAFADTTLLRDTLGLRFVRLFPLSDSLQLLPDTLRALSIRYVWSLERLVFLADSLGVPVDSVGPVIQRERFNPLAATGTSTAFTYNTSYDVAQTQSAWRNAVDFSMGRGALFVNNTTSVQMDRYYSGNATNLRQTRTTATELGWKLSPSFSLGGRVGMDRLDNREQNEFRNFGDARDDYQLSMRSRQKPLRGMNSSLNFLAGLLDITNNEAEKRGLSGNLNGQLRYNPASWLSQEVSGTVDGNHSNTRAADSTTTQRTTDHSENIRGVTSLFPSSPVSLRGGINYRHSQVEIPDTIGNRRNLTDNTSADATLRWRLDNDRSFDMTVRTAGSKQVSASGFPTRTTRRDDSFVANARYLMWGFAVDGAFQNAFSDAKFPTRSDSGGYGEFQHNRNASGTISRPFGARINARFRASIGLVSYRYTVIGKYPTPPVSKDQWRQNWQGEARLAINEKASTGVLLDVTQSQLIQIPGASTGSNNTTRSYAAEWRWSYRLLPDLTVTQRNTLGASYVDYVHLPDNNRVTLDFGTETAMNAVLSPRLTINLRHNSREAPSGSYVVFDDGLEYFARSDETRNSTLSMSIVYVPSPAISLSVEPAYFSSGRTTTANGVEVPQRTSGAVNLSAGAIVNWPVTRNGLLRGDLRRSYRSERATTYTSGVQQFSPRSEADFWNGSLQLSWHL